MEPINFEYVTGTLERPYRMTDEECGPLPIFTDGKQCVSLWHMSLRERLSALVFGKIWVQVLSGVTQPPISLSVARNIFEVDND